MIKNNLTAQNSFIMDETLEVIPKGKEEVKLDILKPHKDGDDIMLKDDVSLAAPVSDQEIAVLEAMAIDLSDLETSITNGGMSQSIALEMMRYCPDIINDNRPKSYFTAMPSRTGLEIALEAIDDKKKTLVSKVKDAINKIIAWILDKYNYYKNKILPIKKSMESDIKAVNNLPADVRRRPAEHLKIAAIKKTTNKDHVKLIKDFDELKYITRIIENGYIGTRTHGESLERMAMIYHGHNTDSAIQNIYAKLNKVSFTKASLASGDDLNLLEDISELVDHVNGIINDTAFINENHIALFNELEKMVYDFKLFKDMPDEIDFTSKLKTINIYQTEDLQEINLLHKCAEYINKAYDFSKKLISAKKDFIDFYTNYINPTSDKAINKFLEVALRTAK